LFTACNYRYAGFSACRDFLFVTVHPSHGPPVLVLSWVLVLILDVKVLVLKPLSLGLGHLSLESKSENRSFWRRSSQPISWLSTEKVKRTPQKQTCIRNKLSYIKLTRKTEARFSRLLWHPAWKQSGPILVSVLQKFVTYLDANPLTYSPGTHTDHFSKNI